MTSRESPGRPRHSWSGADTGPVIPVTGVTVAYVWCHGDPYVFPAGFAEQEHVQVRPTQSIWEVRRRRLGHPSAAYDHQEQPQAAVLEQARADAHQAPCAARRP